MNDKNLNIATKIRAMNSIHEAVVPQEALRTMPVALILRRRLRVSRKNYLLMVLFMVAAIAGGIFVI